MKLTRSQAYALACCYDAIKGRRLGLMENAPLPGGVCDLDWNWSSIKALLTRGLIEEIRATPPPDWIRGHVIGYKITEAGESICETVQPWPPWWKPQTQEPA